MNQIMESSLFATHKVKAHLNLAQNIELISANKNSLKQIFTNLIKNAVEAMDSNKELSIATRNINVNGILKNIYKPVTSTKGKHHSGLGLSIVKNLLDDLKSTITCKTGESGTTFSIHFPLHN